MVEIFHPRVRLVSLVGTFYPEMCFIFILSPFHLHFIQFHVLPLTSFSHHGFCTVCQTLPRRPKRAKERSLTQGLAPRESSDSNQLHHQHCKAILSVFSKSIRSEFPQRVTSGRELKVFRVPNGNP